MLRHFKHYLIGACVLSVVIAGVIVAIAYATQGVAAFEPGPNLIMLVMLIAIGVLGVRRFFNGLAQMRLSRLLAVYDDQCDPEAFVRGMDPIARAFKSPFTARDVWLLSPYGLALADVGRAEEATRLLDTMKKSAVAASKPRDFAIMLMNMEPLARRLLGDEAALPLLIRAEELIDKEPRADTGNYRSYITWERGIIEAQRDGDNGKLIAELQRIRERTSSSWRLRVVCADHEAIVHKVLGDFARERMCLEFIVEHGNLLPYVSPALRRLGELDRMG